MRFKPPWWAWLATGATVFVCGQLSAWQYERGQEKANIIAARKLQSNQTPHDVLATGRIPPHGQRLLLRGHWLDEQEILLDNQTREQQVGVHVWTPLRLSGLGHIVMVNRGWLKTSAYRDQLPNTGSLPSAEVSVSGLWRSFPQAGIHTKIACEQAQIWPQRLNYPQHQDVQCLYSEAVADGLLLMDPEAEQGFVREWLDLGIPSERHYGYSFQWAALAFTALILFLFLNLKREPHG